MRLRPGVPAANGWCIAAGLAIVLSGCTAAPAAEHPLSTHPRTAVASTAAGTPTPSPTLTATARGAVVIPAASNDVDPAHPPYDVIVVGDQTLTGHYTNYQYPVQIPYDDGPGAHAEGTTIEEGKRIVAYRVAPGDIYDFIAKRFHLTDDGYILILNERRRGEAAPLYAGDILNLSAYTLNKYGTVNGRVLDGPRPVTAPQQEP